MTATLSQNLFQAYKDGFTKAKNLPQAPVSLSRVYTDKILQYRKHARISDLKMTISCFGKGKPGIFAHKTRHRIESESLGPPDTYRQILFCTRTY